MLKILKQILLNLKNFRRNFTNGKGYEDLRDLPKILAIDSLVVLIMKKATQWAMQKLKDAGADKVWLQPVMVDVWTRGTESLKPKIGKRNWENIKCFSREILKVRKVKIKRQYYFGKKA